MNGLIVHKTYEQVHAGLFYTNGPARQYQCATCSGKAAHWSYQWTAGENELVCPRGRTYSENLVDYLPQCLSCHSKLDMEKGRTKELVKEGYQKWLSENRALHREISVKAGKARQQKLQKSIELQSVMKGAADKMNAQRRICLECSLESTPTGMAKHLKHSGHGGYRDAI